MRNLHRLFRNARRYQGQFQIRGRLWHAAILARRGRRTAEYNYRWRDLVGVAQPAARGIQRGSKVLRLPVEAGGPGCLAPEHRISADYPRGFRSVPGPGLLRSQPRGGDLDRADHAETADREFEGDSARIVRAHSGRDRRRTGAGLQREEITADRTGFRGRARQSPAAAVRTGQSGPLVAAQPHVMQKDRLSKATPNHASRASQT